MDLYSLSYGVPCVVDRLLHKVLGKQDCDSTLMPGPEVEPFVNVELGIETTRFDLSTVLRVLGTTRELAASL